MSHAGCGGNNLLDKNKTLNVVVLLSVHACCQCMLPASLGVCDMYIREFLPMLPWAACGHRQAPGMEV